MAWNHNLRVFFLSLKNTWERNPSTYLGSCWWGPTWFPVVLGDFGCDVTGQILSGELVLGSKPPPLTRVARTGLGTRLGRVSLIQIRQVKTTVADWSQLLELHRPKLKAS